MSRRYAERGTAKARMSIMLTEEGRDSLVEAAEALGISASAYLERLLRHDLEHRTVAEQLEREFPRDEELPVSA